MDVRGRNWNHRSHEHDSVRVRVLDSISEDCLWMMSFDPMRDLLQLEVERNVANRMKAKEYYSYLVYSSLKVSMELNDHW